MVLPELDEPSPDSSGPIDRNPTSFVGYNSGEQETVIGPGPGGKWTIEQIKKLFEQQPLYPNPFPPVPLYAKLLGYSEKSRDESIAANVNRAGLFIGRPLTPEEVQAETHYHSAFTESLCKSELIGTVSCLGLAALRQRAGRPGILTPHIYKYLGEELGKWYIRICRYGIYGYFGRLQGQIIGALITANRTTSMMKHDPNVQNIMRDMGEAKKVAQEEVEYRIKERRAGGPKRPLVPTPEEIGNKINTLSPSKATGDHQNGKDTSYEWGEAEGLSAEDSSKRSAHHSSVSLPTDNRPISPENYDDEDPFGDSVFPISSDSPRAQPQQATQGNPGESAWSRLRRKAITSHDASNNSSSSPEPESSWARFRQVHSDQPSNVPKTDFNIFAATDAERAFAKNEAQKQFDERLEKERKGVAGRGWVKSDDAGVDDAQSRRKW